MHYKGVCALMATLSSVCAPAPLSWQLHSVFQIHTGCYQGHNKKVLVGDDSQTPGQTAVTFFNLILTQRLILVHVDFLYISWNFKKGNRINHIKIWIIIILTLHIAYYIMIQTTKEYWSYKEVCLPLAALFV